MTDYPRLALDVQTLATERLSCEPLRPEHADVMQPLLDDPDLHTFIGGRPATLAQLRDRYARMSAGRSADNSQQWLNWVLRRRDTGDLVGTVQATISVDGVLTAEVAWVIVSAAQGRGYATEAATALAAALRANGVDSVIAHVHPDHAASNAVARAIGLAPTDTMVDGERRWQG